MLVILIIILLLIGAAVVGSIYSNFVVFYSNFFESENYHKAYYASISALERGELVTKQRQPGYIGSGGVIMGIGTGIKVNSIPGGSDSKLDDFSYFDNNNESSVFWTVNSRTTRIPTISGGDVEWMLSADDSPNYNTMGFENSEVFLLYYDKSEGNPYNSGDVNIIQSSPKSITGEIRLPKQLFQSGGYGFLDTENSLIGKEGELPKDDAIVDRQIRGELSNGTKFTVYSTQSTSRSNITYGLDSIFRESDINKPLSFEFSDSYDTISSVSLFSNLGGGNMHGEDASITIISPEENVIKDYQNEFQDIFQNPNTSLRLSLLNLLKTTHSGQYYPFLEYYADFGTDVADKYYTIDAEGNYKDYQVNTIIQKPTVKETVLGNFTSVF